MQFSQAREKRRGRSWGNLQNFIAWDFMTAASERAADVVILVLVTLYAGYASCHVIIMWQLRRNFLMALRCGRRMMFVLEEKLQYCTGNLPPRSQPCTPKYECILARYTFLEIGTGFPGVSQVTSML